MFIPGHRFMTIIILGIIITVIMDTSIPSVSVYTGGLSSSLSSIISFGIIALIYAVGQYLILQYVKSKIKSNKKNGVVSKIHTFVYVAQFVLIGIIIIIICQMILYGSYHSLLLKGVVWINYIIASILFGFLGARLFLWNRLKQNMVLISYSIAVIGLSVACFTTVLYVTHQLEGQRGIEYIYPIKSALVLVADADNIFSMSYMITSIVSFIVVWIATALLLHHYSAKLGKTKYWVMVLIPLAYFLTQFQSFIPEVFREFHESDPISYGVAYTLFFNISKPVGGILFGMAFWGVTRSVRQFVVRDYMVISAYGIMLFFTVHQPVTLTLIPYPPFGIPTMCFIGLSSYLVLVGIYSSSISIASDTELLKAVRKSLPERSNLLGIIGSAQEIQRIQSKALKITNQLSDKMTKETGIQPSIDEQDIKDYLKEILEIKEKHKNLKDT